MSGLAEGFYVGFGLLSTIFNILVSQYLPFIERHPSVEDIKNPKVLSKLLNKQVSSVQISQKVSAGAGGNGTTRQALTAVLEDGSELHLFIKTPAGTLMERAFLTFFKIYESEVRFYCSLLPKLLAVHDPSRKWLPYPNCYCVKQYRGGDFLIILEDTRYRPEGCCFRDVSESPVSHDTVKSIMHAFAQLHVIFWNNPPDGIWSFDPVTGEARVNTPPILRNLIETALAQVKKRYGNRIKLHADVLEGFYLGYANNAKIRAFWSKGPLTMCHGDSHPGNIFYNSDMTEIGFIDFQCVAAEHGLRDISYHLQQYPEGYMTPELEESLIRHYLSKLRDELVLKNKGEFALKQIPTFEEAFFMYRLYSLWTLTAWVMTSGFSDVVQEDFAVLMLNRTFNVCRRLQMLDAIKQVLGK